VSRGSIQKYLQDFIEGRRKTAGKLMSHVFTDETNVDTGLNMEDYVSQTQDLF